MKYKAIQKIKHIIDKLKRKYLIFIFNSLLQNNKSEEQHHLLVIYLFIKKFLTPPATALTSYRNNKKAFPRVVYANYNTRRTIVKFHFIRVMYRNKNNSSHMHGDNLTLDLGLSKAFIIKQ